MKLKILIITPRIPYPPFRGDKLKIFNIYKMLARNNQVKILTFIGKSSESGDVEELRKIGVEIETVNLPRKKALFNLWRSLFTLKPLQISYYHSVIMHERIKELTGGEEYDVIYFHLINSVQYLKASSGSVALKVIDFTDATSLYLKRYLEFLKNPMRKFVFYNELKRIMRYEKKVREFDTLFVCSPVDKNFLEERKIHSNIRLLLNGVNLETFDYKETEPEKGRVVFAGNMTYFPNIDAAVYFANEIFPLILKKIPYAKFYIVGQQPPEEIEKLRSDNIIITGFVPDIAREYSLSEVNIAPIRFGSGTLNKIIEAIAMGVPTVATNLSMQGFPNELRKYVFTADNPEQFADEVIKLMGNKGVRDNLMKEGVEKIRSLLSWEAIVGDFENYLTERIKARGK